MAAQDEALAIAVEVDDELKKIQQFLSLEFAFADGTAHQDAFFTLQAHLQLVQGRVHELGSLLADQLEGS